MLSLSLLESLMKNCGTPMHDEVCGSDFVMSLLEHLHSTEEIRVKVLGLIQNWEHAFKKNPNYHNLHNAFAEIKRSGATLPPFRESEAMFAAEVAPGWKDGDSCYRCRTSFNAFRRKHHCRNCGNVFCGECTTGRAVIPKYGIEREVRVCETCLPTLTGAHRVAPAASKTDGGASHSQSTAMTEAEKAARDRELQLREEEELQLALALSASEAESKQKTEGGQKLYQKAAAAASGAPAAAPRTATTPPAQPTVAPPGEVNGEGTEVDAELARYLNRNYWTNRASAVGSDAESVVAPMMMPTAPIFNPPVNPDYEPSLRGTPIPNGTQLPTVEVPAEGLDLPGVPPLTTEKQEEFLTALRKSLDVFVNRMRISGQRGRSIANDSTIQTLFHTLHAMHPQLLQYASGLEQRRVFLEQLQDQTVQLREAREALDALRNEHAEARRREEEEAQRRRQFQMMQKVEALRQQKQQAIENQRQLALEQTLQYQQQYQYQQLNAYGLDPATGLPLQPGMMPPMMAGAYGGQPGMEYGYGGAYQPAPAGVPAQQAMGAPYMYSVAPTPAPPPLDNVAPGVAVNPPAQSEADSQQQQQPAPAYMPPATTNDATTAYDMKSVAQALPPPQQSYPNQSTTPAYLMRMPTPPTEDPQATMKKSPADAQLIMFD
ncbi:hypothetical protein SprV_0501854500 [Sparganum proliferum]